ncbi:hypothetical protein ACQPZX_03585 [Actinoplanes sp. CA-142083]|uniref:hypothetical protein n=1 Tax=Actinoplanes sp. CA-142083 TaxID=3239903 RepID=UPI003D8E96BC
MGFAIAYEIENGPVPAAGYLLSEDGLEHLTDAVRKILRDDTGVAEAWEALRDLPKTSFAEGALRRVLAAPESFDEWRVGEALAEHHLTEVRGCMFPWPDSRSARNPNSSSGGVDILGFHNSDRVRFVFGEVKTSHEEKWPPQVVTSRSHGLQTQLSGIGASDDRSRWGIRYLGMNSLGKPWHENFRSAMQTYLENAKDVMIFGVLVHVTKPNMKDLKALSEALVELPTAGTTMELICLYVGAESLKTIAGGSILVETVL